MSQHSFHLVRALSETLDAKFRAIVAKPGGSKLSNASWSCDVTDDLRAVAQQAPDRREYRRRNLIRTRSRGHPCE